MEDEACLLGYPLCCVRDHYRCSRLMNEALAIMLTRIAKGDIDEMKRLVREDVALDAKIEEEISRLKETFRLVSAPFTSVYMCVECERNSNSPARKMSETYKRLAETVDLSLARDISAYEAAFNTVRES